MTEVLAVFAKVKNQLTWYKMRLDPQFVPCKPVLRNQTTATLFDQFSDQI